MLKTSLVIIALLIFNCVKSQQNEIQEIYSLLKNSENFAHTDGMKALENIKTALDISKKIKNEELIIESSIELAFQLSILNSYKESLNVVTELENEIVIKDGLIKYEIKSIRYYNYYALNLKDLALNELKEAELILKKLDSEEAKISSADLYIDFAHYYGESGNYHLANQYVDKALKISHDVTLDFMFQLYLEKVYTCIGLEQLDSSQIYINKVYEEYSKYFDGSSLHVLYEIQGYQHLKSGNHKKAIEFYHMALDQMENDKLYDLSFSARIKSDLAQAYGQLGDIENQNKYKAEANKDEWKLKDKTNEGLVQAVNNILNDGKKESNEIKNQNRWIIAGISSVSFALLSFLYHRYQKIKQRKKLILQQKENLILKNLELEIKTENLNKKAEENQLVELINLAKTNNPYFVVLFEELFPDFVTHLKSLNPKITNSELQFLGLAFLNFTTKEIAEITYVTVAAVNLRKHRIRKKYNIHSDKDFNAWIMELNIASR